MYVRKYWGNYIGASDDSLNLLAMLDDQKKDEISLEEIFEKTGLDKYAWNFRNTQYPLEYTDSSGLIIDFHLAIDLIADIAALMLECSVCGTFNISEFDQSDSDPHLLRITATSEEHSKLEEVLEDFIENHADYDLASLIGEEDTKEMAELCKELSEELFHSSGRNKQYHIPTKDMKNLLTSWQGADGCIASSRIMIEGCPVGYCYREEPDNSWDSGWRFTAGDESDEYMNDSHNAGIYKLNTLCNEDPDILPLLNTPFPCAFERDENGNFKSVPFEREDEEDSEDRISVLLKQCQKWHEKEKHKKIISILEKIPEEERTAEVLMELARAYNNIGNVETEDGRQAFHTAISYLKSCEDELGDTYSWNFRMGYAYFYLDNMEMHAIRYLEKALELHPGDNPKLNSRDDIKYMIYYCKEKLTYPSFDEDFRHRTEKAWALFEKEEENIRKLMDEDDKNERGAELIEKCDSILSLVSEDISFEIGHNGEKHELILTPEGDKVKLFELVYFKNHTPEKVKDHWNILVGRQPTNNMALRIGDEWDINGDDIQIWIGAQEKGSFSISAYCEKLLPLLEKDEGRAWWMLTTAMDQELGEIPHMRHIDDFEVLREPKEEPPILLSHLAEKMKEMGLDMSTNPDAYLDIFCGYSMKPENDSDTEWRLDLMAGSTNCPALINGYLENDNTFIDELHADGVAAGYFVYPLETLVEDEGSQKIFDFREALENRLLEAAGEDAITLTGGATGIFHGYVDFIAWDLEAVLNAARKFFAETDVAWAHFHSFRRDAGYVRLKKTENENEIELDNQDELDIQLTGVDYIPYSEQNEEEFFKQLEKWNDEDEYTRCIQLLNTIPEEKRNYRISYWLVRALENYAIIGDHDEGTARFKGDKALLKAIRILKSVEEEGKDKKEWNMRMAYGYQYLTGQEHLAIPYARKWEVLDPEDKDAEGVIDECLKEIVHDHFDHDILCEKIDELNNSDDFETSRFILESIPENRRNLKETIYLARSYNNIAMMDRYEDDPEVPKLIKKAIRLLESVENEGKDDALWNMRMGYALYSLGGHEMKALPYFETWARLEPDNSNAKEAINECKEILKGHTKEK